MTHGSSFRSAALPSLCAIALAAASAASVRAYSLFCGSHSRARATVTLNPNCRDASAGTMSEQEAAVASALDTWSTAGSNFRFTYGGRTTRAAVAPTDGRHDVFWSDRTEGVAVAITYCGGDDVEKGSDIENLDVHNFTLGSGIGFDIETVSLHELGHLLGLGHTSENGAVMRSSYEGVRRALGADDLAGLRFIYGTDTSPPNVIGVEPECGHVRGGNAVDVVGTSFGADSSVTFDGVPVAILGRRGTTAITVLAPPWTISGQVVDVRVSQGTGSDTLRNAYTYIENSVEIGMVGTPLKGETIGIVVYGPPFERAALVAGAPGTTVLRGKSFCFDLARSRVLATLKTLSIPARGETAPIPIRLGGRAFLTFHVQGVVTTRLGLLQTNCIPVTIFP